MSKLVTEEALTGALTIVKSITDSNKTLAESAQTTANNAATAAQTAQSTATAAQTTANSAATAAQTAQSTADAKQGQLYLHDIVIDDSNDSGGVVYIKVILQQSNAITTESGITQALLDKALSIAYNLDGLNEWLINLNTITKTGTDVAISGTFISSNGIATNSSSVDASVSTITDTVVAL